MLLKKILFKFFVSFFTCVYMCVMCACGHTWPSVHVGVREQLCIPDCLLLPLHGLQGLNSDLQVCMASFTQSHLYP